MLGGERRLYFELAEKLGMTVEDMLNRMSSRELTEWIELFRIRRVEYQHERDSRS